jgi:tape measure domain-containing protein
MANQTQDVELRIRASNYSKQTTDQVVDALKKMTAAQDAQIEAAKNGTVTVQQLEKSYTDLESAAKALLGQNSLIKLFQSQTQTLADLESKLAAARKAQQDFINASNSGIKPSKTYAQFMSENMADFVKSEGSQKAAMQRMKTAWAEYKAEFEKQNPGAAAAAGDAKKLKDAVASAEKEMARAQGRIETTQKRLAEFGINSTDAAAAQQKIVAAVSAANTALERQDAAISTHDAHAAARKAQADAIVQREAQVKVDNIFAQAERDVAAALEAERKAQVAANQAANDKNRERQVEVDVMFAQAQRQAAEELNRKTAAINAQKAAMQAAADQAERMSRGAGTTARGTGPVSTPNVAGQIRDIQNPNDAAVRSLDGIEQAVAKLERRVSEIRGPVKDYRGAIEETTRAQKALMAVAGDIDAYQRQQTAVRAAGTEFGRAQAEVRRLVAELRSGNAGEDVTTRLSRAQNTMQQAAQRLGNVRTEARAMQAALQAAGVDTRNLSAAEQALVAQANRATTALNALNAAHQRHGAAADDSGSRLFRWFGGDGGRTTLSYMQRMRGELLSLAAGFVGLNATIELGKKSLEAYQNNQAIMSRLTIANGGDVRKAADDFKYLQAQADRIGFSFAKVAPAFTKFSIAAHEAGWNTQQTRFSFEQIAGAAVKARLSTEDLEGVMKAFEQMMSKGTIQAEELRGQLGDRLPGAFQIAARAAKMSVEDYTKAVSEGKIGSDQVLAIARELGKTYGVAQKGAETLLEAQARFDNAANRFLTNTAAGGYVQSFQALLNKLTEMMNNGQADKLAAQLSAGFSAVIDVLSFVSDHIDAIKDAIKALIAVGFIKWLLALPGFIRMFKAELILASAELRTFQRWLAVQEVAAAASTALGAGGLTGVVARLTPVLTGAASAAMLLTKGLGLLAVGYAAYEATKTGLSFVDDNERAKVKDTINATTKALQDAAHAQQEYEKTIGTANEARFKGQRDRFQKIATDALKAQSDAVKAAGGFHLFSNGPDKILNEDVQNALKRQAAITNTPKPGTDDYSGATPDPGNPSGERQRRAQLQKALDAEDKKTQRQMKLARLKAEKGDLAERLEIIKEWYDDQKEKYRAATKDDVEYNEAVKKIDASYAKAAALERQKYANEQAKQGESAAKKRATLMENLKEQVKAAEADIAKSEAKQDRDIPFEKRMDARVDAVMKAYDAMNKEIAKLRPLDPAAAAAFDKRLEKIKTERAEIEKTNAIRDEANVLLDEYNKKQGILNNQIAAIKTEHDMGFIDDAEAAKRISEQVKTWAPEIDAAGQAALKFAAFNANALDPTRFAEIVSTIRQGMARNNADAQAAVTNMNAAQAQMNELLAMQQREMDKIHTQRQIGKLDANQEVDAINATTAKYAGSIQYMAQELLNFVAIVREKGGMKPEELAVIEAAAGRVLTVSKANVAVAKEWETTLVQSVTQNGVTAFDQMAESIAKVVNGQQSVAEGFHGMLRAAGTFFASLMRDLAAAILRTMILKALSNSTMFGSGVSGAATQMLAGHHNGGIAGSTPTFSRMVPASSMRAAIRYHTGGIAGFAPNEVPAVLQKGEEVLTRDDPRHVLNGGARAAEGGGSQRFVLVDDRSQVPQAMASAEGEKVVLVHLKNNLPTIKAMLR